MKPAIKLATFLAISTIASIAWGACEDSVFVQVNEQAGTVTPKEITVCQGGTVEWNSEGPTRFQVIFAGQRAGATTRNDPLTHIIEATAPIGDYRYDVRIGSTVLDPVIRIR